MELKHRKNITLKIAVVLTASFLWAVPAQACSACFYGDPTQKSIIAVQWGVATLLMAVLGVLLAFLKFFISFNKRAQHLNKANTI